MSWDCFTPEELERRRQLSLTAMQAREEEAWQARYQQICDREYWTFGQCCAGCDHWQSDAGLTGNCAAAGIVSGYEVLRSMDVSFSSYIPKPGFPYTRAEFHCGKFSDAFEWSTLDCDYLERIGAMKNGQLRQKPTHRRRQ